MLKSFSKINLSLSINKKFKNGLHDIQSYFCLINLYDQIEIKKIKGQAISVNTYDLKSVMNSVVTIFPTVEGKSVVSGTYQNSSTLQIASEDTNTLLGQAETFLGIFSSS